MLEIATSKLATYREACLTGAEDDEVVLPFRPSLHASSPLSPGGRRGCSERIALHETFPHS